MSADDSRERIAALEVKVLHLTEKFTNVERKVDEMHGILMQARGARYVIVAAAAMGGFVSAKLAPFLPWFGAK